MNDFTDQQLLRDYAEHESEPAFAEIVLHHLIGLVYSAALRMVFPHGGVGGGLRGLQILARHRHLERGVHAASATELKLLHRKSENIVAT